ncbi:Zinc finger, CCHC-type [Sesbania bispinosa]|nr:Zinc finger, CCHC-type [Sesbania bispinosa]
MTTSMGMKRNNVSYKDAILGGSGSESDKGLPVEYYEIFILWKIGHMLGKTIKLDSDTLNPKKGVWGASTTKRAKFARVCIKVDLRKTLISRFKLNDRVYNVEYEGLHLVCFSCGKYNHRREECIHINPNGISSKNFPSNNVNENEGGGCLAPVQNENTNFPLAAQGNAGNDKNEFLDLGC